MQFGNNFITMGRARRPGLGTLIAGGGGIVYSPEAQQLFDRMGADQPNGARKLSIDAFIQAIPNVWPKADAIYETYYADNQAQAVLNWKSASYPLTAVGSISYARLTGLAGRVSTGFDPSAGGTNFVQDSGSIGYFTPTAGQSDNLDAGNANTLLLVRNTTNQISTRINAATTATTSNTDGAGRYIVSRTGASLTRRFKNGVQLGTDSATASITPTSSIMQFNGRNGSAGDGSRVMNFGIIASGLTADDIAELEAAYFEYEATEQDFFP